MNMLYHSSGEGCHLLGCRDHLGAGLGEVAMDVCSSAGDVLAGGANMDDKGNHPSKMW